MSGDIRAAVATVLRAKAAALVARSADVLESLLDDPFTYVNAGGRVMTRTAYIAAFTAPGGVTFLSQEVSDLAVADHGGFAVATMTVHDVYESEAGRFDGRMRALAVFRRAPEGWRWSGGQTMTLRTAD